MRATGAMPARIGPAVEVLQHRGLGSGAPEHLVVPALVVESNLARQRQLTGSGQTDTARQLIHCPTLAAVTRDGILELQV